MSSETQNGDDAAEDPSPQYLRNAVHYHVNFQSLKMAALLFSVVLYFAFAAVLFMFITGEGWDLGHCLYYAVVIVTTVGYGDFLPTTPGMKIGTMCLVLIGLSVVVLALGIIQDIIVSAASEKAVGKASDNDLFNVKAGRRRDVRAATAVFLLYILFLILGTVVFGLEFKHHEDSSSETPFLDGLYLSVITLTTVGFGDFTPLSDGGKGFSCFFMLVGIPIQLGAFGLVSSVLLPQRKDKVHASIRKVKSKLTMEKFKSITHFADELTKVCPGYSSFRHHEGHFSRFEYLAFLLVQNGLVDMKNVTSVMSNFDKLDKSRTGYVGPEDVDSGMSQHSIHDDALVSTSTSYADLGTIYDDTQLTEDGNHDPRVSL